MMLGFVIYQFGLLVTFRLAGLRSQLPTLVPTTLSADLVGMALQFGGGIIGIVGFIVCISGVASTYHEKTLRGLYDLIGGRSEQHVTPSSRCRFCGAEIKEQAVFCPVCSKSQR